MNKLLKEELLMGASASLAFWPLAGWWALLGVVPCGLLWAISGAGGSKLYRRLGVPLAISLAVYGFSWMIVVSTLIGFGVLSIGYGIQDKTDEGSALGRFWYWIVGGDESLAEQLTRATLALLLALAYLPIVFMHQGELLNYLFSVVFLMVSHILTVTYSN